LFGLISTIARVRGVSNVAARSGSGTKPSSGRHGSGNASTPCIVNAMALLKYHGTGSITWSPAPHSTVSAMVNARFAPAVMATSPASRRAP